MKPLVFAGLIPLLLLGQSPADLLGRWRSLETSSGGIGAMFEFREGNLVNFSPGAVVPMSYRIDGDELTLPSATKDGAEQKVKVEWRGNDQLRLSFDALVKSRTGEAHWKELSRRGVMPDSKTPIVGEWVGSREMPDGNHEFRYLFYPRGKVLFLIPFRTQQGTYTVRDGTIRLVLPDTGAFEGKFNVDGDVLTMPGPRGTGESKFARY